MLDSGTWWHQIHVCPRRLSVAHAEMRRCIAEALLRLHCWLFYAKSLLDGGTNLYLICRQSFAQGALSRFGIRYNLSSSPRKKLRGFDKS